MPQTSATVTCPKCRAPFELTDALAAPMLADARADFQQKLQAQQQELARAAAAQKAAAEKAKADAETERLSLHRERTVLEQQRRDEAEQIKTEVQRRTAEALQRQLAEEKKRIAEDERRRAAAQFAEELAERDRDAKEKDERISKLNARAGELAREQAEFRKREQAFADKEREFELRLQTEISGQLDQVRAVATSEAEQRLNLQLGDKDRTIRELAAKLEDASRKAQQGSQQAQGETLELILEEQLRRQFPYDTIQPVPKGEFGGDTLQVVRDTSGRECGRILWEFKRTKNWDAKWVAKLKNDQREARAEVAVIVSQAMPPDIQRFEQREGVWVSSLDCTVPVAHAMRSTLLQLATQRRSSEGQLTKSELVYRYLNGPQFRARIDAIAERWRDMRKELDSEKTFMQRQWTRREKQLDILLESTQGIYGDLEGITGRDLGELASLEEPLALQAEASS